MTENHFRNMRPAQPPADLRARVMRAAATVTNETAVPTLGWWTWLRPQLGWMAGAALLLVAHALLDTLWPVSRGVPMARVRPAISRPEPNELAEVGIPRQLVADMTSVSRARPALDPALVRELL